jgi:hypothetical protein
MRWLAALSLCAAIAACKEKQEAPGGVAKPAPSAPAAPAAKASSPDEITAEGPAKPGIPITVEEATAALPTLGGTTIIALKQTPDKLQVHGTWCIDGTSAGDVAKHIGDELAAAKYENVSIRGDARKAGVAGDRGEIRFSMVVSASSAQICAAPVHDFASATIFKR